MKKFLLPVVFLSVAHIYGQGIRIEGTNTRIVCSGSPYIVMNNMGWANNGSNNALSAGNSTVQLTGNATVAVTTNNAYSTQFYNLQTNKTGGSEIDFSSNNMNIIVSNTLTMTSGNVDMNNNTGSNLTLGTSTANLGTLSRTSGHVYNGFFQKWYSTALGSDNTTAEFPVGMNASSYNFARVVYTSAPSSGGTIRTRFMPSNPMYTGLPLTDNTNTTACGGPVSINNAANEGYWEIIPTNGMPNDGAYTVRLCYNNFTTIGSPNCLRILKSENHLAWMQEGTHGVVDNVTTFSVTRTAQTGYSWFTLSGDSLVNALPIQLAAFNAECGNNEINITWSTATEQNNAYFTLERSKDAVIWETITTIPGAGNSNNLLNYAYNDTYFADGIYYRLSQTDYNGSNETFSPVYTKCNENSTIDLINAYTNHGGGVVVVFNAGGIRDYTLDIYDVRGRKLNRVSGTSANGVNQTDVHVENFSDAIYMITLSAGDETITKKFMVH